MVFCYSKNVLKRLYYDYYFHRQEDLWRKNALKTLPALLNSSNMLACGEDLGLVPACVHPVCYTMLSSLLIHPASHHSLCRSIHVMCWPMLKSILTQVMKELALVGLRIQRMPSESDVEFGVPSNYDYMTVRSLSS